MHEVSKELQALRVGMILYLYQDVLHDEKFKYFLVVDASDPPRLLILNRRKDRVIERRPELNDCQIHLHAKDHSGAIKQDCFVDCTAVFDDFSYEDIDCQLTGGLGHIMGAITDSALNEVRDALDRDVRIAQLEKSIILEKLDRYLDRLT
jgi:hypothetical protein